MPYLHVRTFAETEIRLFIDGGVAQVSHPRQQTLLRQTRPGWFEDQDTSGRQWQAEIIRLVVARAQKDRHRFVAVGLTDFVKVGFVDLLYRHGGAIHEPDLLRLPACDRGLRRHAIE